MSVAAVLLLVTTSLYAGFQWTIRMVVYPQFAMVGRPDFAAYEQRHQRLLTVTVGPLFVLEAVAVLAALATDLGAASVTAAVACALVVVITATRAVPAHRALTGGFDEAVHRRLLRIDSVRLVLAVVAVAAAVCFAA